MSQTRRIREENTETKVVTEKELEKGVWMSSITNIKEIVVDNVPPFFWYCLIFYFICTMIAFGAFLYQDGKHGLLTFRHKTRGNQSVEAIEELTAIKEAMHGWRNLYEAVWWPYFMWMQLIPPFILWMNPRKDDFPIRVKEN